MAFDKRLAGATAAIVAGIILITTIAAQDAQPKSAPGTAPAAGSAEQKDDLKLPKAAPGDQVVIKRDAVRPIDPLRYRFALYLTPIRNVTMVAPFDGVVRSVSAKAGESLPAQAEAIRLDNTAQKFVQQRAQSLYKAALLEQKLAGGGSSDQQELQDAKVEAAKAELDLATFQLEQAVVRAPFHGEILRLHVSEGQFVRAGDPVAAIGDTSKLQVEIPIARELVANTKSLPIKIEGNEVSADVQAVVPLDSKFDSLRELFDSLTSAQLVIDNKAKSFQPGQTVFAAAIPRHPVVEVATSAIGNRADGGRKVQVLRDSIVRDIPVELMGGIGVDRIFINGPFSEGDEVIVESSHQLADGFPVKSGGSTSAGGKAKDRPNTKPATTPSDF
jgi:RND family efflux transporter MFP subunit